MVGTLYLDMIDTTYCILYSQSMNEKAGISGWKTGGGFVNGLAMKPFEFALHAFDVAGFFSIALGEVCWFLCFILMLYQFNFSLQLLAL